MARQQKIDDQPVNGTSHGLRHEDDKEDDRREFVAFRLRLRRRRSRHAAAVNMLSSRRRCEHGSSWGRPTESWTTWRRLCEACSLRTPAGETWAPALSWCSTSWARMMLRSSIRSLRSSSTRRWIMPLFVGERLQGRCPRAKRTCQVVRPLTGQGRSTKSSLAIARTGLRRTSGRPWKIAAVRSSQAARSTREASVLTWIRSGPTGQVDHRRGHGRDRGAARACAVRWVRE
eukprot:3710197-Prymnesium_polylepis.1